jgi:uncharacterized protein (DUF433 family)
MDRRRVSHGRGTDRRAACAPEGGRAVVRRRAQGVGRGCAGRIRGRATNRADVVPAIVLLRLVGLFCLYDVCVANATEMLRERALVPRYTVKEAAAIIERRAQTTRRWALGYDTTYLGERVHYEPLIVADGDVHESVSLSLTNLLELRMLSNYRGDVSLQAIRRALDYAATEMGEPRPLVTVEFKAISGELFAKFTETPDGRQLLVNASRRGQFVMEMTQAIETVTADVDYVSEVAKQWWYRGRNRLVVIDTTVAAGQPITAESGVRVSAVVSRKAEGFTLREIVLDTGASDTEVAAALSAAA